MPLPNASISLYKGRMEFRKEEIILQGDGRLDFEWLPSPKIRFNIDNASLFNTKKSFKKLLGKGVLSLLDADTKIYTDAYASRLLLLGDSVVGYAEKAISLGSGQSLSYVLCHLVNFPKFLGGSVSSSSGNASSSSRIVFEAEDWRITIDAVEEISNLIGALEALGGYAITHVAKLERSNGESFSSDEVKNWLDALSFFLSFARGFHSPLVLSVGFDENGKKVWEEWDSQRRSTPWKGVISWFPETHPSGLVGIFPNFMKYWNNQIWNEDIRQVLTWYIDSNSASSNIEGLIIWIHSALELLFWVYFIKEKGESKKKFTNEKLNKLISRLIEEFSISKTLPQSLTKLAQVAQKMPDKCIDGPYTFVEVRNSIIHGNWRERFFNSNQQELYREARSQAYTLGLWYLEMVLLKLLDYQGHYFNRLRLWAEEIYSDCEPFT
ncbi:hypothetical protein [Microcoleus sp. FACHB-831]|uniref:hypothetical protein n=1 Tax=Microcoleus sp. FACHB-831 TaxID=2692827 RepID=UPI001688C0AD|nr:hypothetical protein [Microcoleus sp. FACHB-831]